MNLLKHTGMAISALVYGRLTHPGVKKLIGTREKGLCNIGLVISLSFETT